MPPSWSNRPAGHTGAFLVLPRNSPGVFGLRLIQACCGKKRHFTPGSESVLRIITDEERCCQVAFRRFTSSLSRVGYSQLKKLGSPATLAASSPAGSLSQIGSAPDHIQDRGNPLRSMRNLPTSGQSAGRLRTRLGAGRTDGGMFGSSVMRDSSHVFRLRVCSAFTSQRPFFTRPSEVGERQGTTNSAVPLCSPQDPKATNSSLSGRLISGLIGIVAVGRESNIVDSSDFETPFET